MQRDSTDAERGVQDRTALDALGDMTWEERALQLQARANTLTARRPSMELLDALSLSVNAYRVALAEAELVDVASGDAA